ncbi:hypothetical protein JCM8208_000922 [Rhodotorula glutinis]
MSDRLDDDVLELVLDELSPLTSTGLAYRDVKRTILCLCRTSRRFRLLAQPFLWRQVQVTGPKQLEQLRACSAATGLGRHTVAYEVESPYSHSVNGALAVADVLPNIVKLRVSAAQAPVDVALFAQYHALEHLDLQGVVLDGPLPPPSCTIKHLIIVDSSASTSFMRQWLTSARLPGLHTVYVDHVTDLSSSSPIQLGDILGRPVLDQLDCIYGSSPHADPQSALGGGVDPPVLFLDHHPSVPLPRHSGSRVPPISAYRALRDICASIDRVEARPTSEPPVAVVLTAQLAKLAAGAPAALKKLFETLELACTTHRVHIIWASEPRPGFERARTLGCDEFWQYARELRAARAAREGSTSR